jgi:thymidine phosphorylase
LIVSSILSKKLAAGLDALVMDIKVGSGAFMKSLPQAHELAERLCRTAGDAGLACHALLSDMSQPMSSTAGNALEMREACDYLLGQRRHPRLHELVMAIGSEMLLLGRLQDTQAAANAKLQQALDSGAAAEKFARMVADQDGPADLLQHPDRYLAVADFARPLQAAESGYLTAMNMTQIGLAVVRLGGGRFLAEDSIDHAVGLSDLPVPGQYLEKGEDILMIHARNESDWSQAAAQCRVAIEISGRATEPSGGSIILDRIRGALESNHD